MKKVQQLTFLLILTICFCSCKQNYITSSGGKQISVNDLDKFLQAKMDSMEIPGLSIVLIENAEVAYHRTFGLKNSNSTEKIDNNTIFEAASLSKPLFAYFVMKQVEKGLIDLDKPLYEYLPYPDVAHDDRYKLITARIVLSHQTGFPNWRPNRWDQKFSDMKFSDRKFDMEFEPGTKFKYSGEGYQYLAKVIAHINNVEEGNLDSIFQKEVAEPLGAEYLSYNWNVSIAKHKAYGHWDGKPTHNGIGDINVNEFGAAHSLHTEPINYSKFIIALMQRKGLTQESFNELFKEQVKVPKENNFFSKATGNTSWGLGLGIQPTSHGLQYSHYGDNGHFSSYFNFYLNQKSGIILFTNSYKLYTTNFISDLGKFLGEEIKCDITLLENN